MKVPVDKIGEVIGPKGKVINQIQDDTGAQISHRGRRHDLHRCRPTARPPRPPGRRSTRSPTRRCPRSASATSAPSSRRPTSVRSSRCCRARTACCTSASCARLAGGKRVENVEDVVSVGQKIQVEIGEIDDRGKLSLIPVVEESAATAELRRRRRSTADAWRSAAQQKPGTTRTLLSGQDGAAHVRRTVPPGRAAGRDRGDARRPVRLHRGVGRRRLPRRDADPVRGLALPRAPALQGHADALGAGHLGRRSTRWAASSTRSPRKEYTCFHARVLDEDLPLAVDVLGDMITSSTITAEDVEAEREVILDEIAMHDDDPDDVVSNVFAEQAWGDLAAGPSDRRHRRVDQGADPRPDPALLPVALHPGEHGRRGRRQRRPRDRRPAGEAGVRRARASSTTTGARPAPPCAAPRRLAPYGVRGRASSPAPSSR